MKGHVVAFRIPPEQYAELEAYARKHNITVSDAVRRAVRWMMLLYGGKP